MSVASARRRATGPIGAFLALVATLCLTLAGCSGSGTSKAPAAKPTPLSQLSTASMSVPRIDFCALVPKKAVTDALGGGQADGATAWGNGDVTAVTPTVRDAVHELGCEWRTSEGVTARAWVFARPVTAAVADTVATAGAREPGCSRVTGPPFGTSSLDQECALAGHAFRVRHAGLFGQTWFSCEVSDPTAARPAVRKRADAWCVQVVTALDKVR